MKPHWNKTTSGLRPLLRVLSARALGLCLGSLLLSTATPTLGQGEIKDPLPPRDRGSCQEGVNCVSPAADSTGRIDQFGYTFVSNASGSCAADWTDISATGSAVQWNDPLSNDDTSASIPIASFNFYGVDYTALTMATNGYLSTDPLDEGTSLGNAGSLCPLPERLLTGRGGRIHALLDDLVTADAYVEYFEECPRPSDRCRAAEPCTVFQWHDSYHVGTPGQTFDVETILYHWTNDVVVQYQGDNPEDGLNSTTGIQDVPEVAGPPSSTPQSGLTYQCDYPSSMLAGSSVCFQNPTPLPDACVFSDVSIAKSSDAALREEPGEEVVYTLNVENEGPDTARDVLVTDNLDEGLTWVSDSCGAGPPAGNILTWGIGAMDAAAMESCDITVEVTGERGVTVDNTALAELDNHDPNESNNTSNLVEFDIGFVSELSLQMTSDAAPRVEPGTTVIYTLTVTNDGPDETINASVSDTLPSSVLYISDDCGGGLAGQRDSQGAWSWDPGVLESGESAVCHLSVEVVGARGSTVLNTAVVEIDNLDSNLADNTDSTTFKIGFISDVLMTKTSNAAPRVEPGTEVIFTLAVNNRGPEVALNARVSDTLPAGVAYVSDDCGGVTQRSNGATAWSWTPGEVAAEQIVTCNITTTVVGQRGTRVSNTASLAIDNVDPNLADNSSTAAFDIGFRSNLKVTQGSDAASSIPPHSEVVYTVTVSNPVGPDPSINTRVVEELPSDLSYVSDSCGGEISDDTWTWNIGNLGVGNSVQCTLTVVVRSIAGTTTSTAIALQDSIEDDDLDNQATTGILVEPSSETFFFDDFEEGLISKW